jgi:hypothetical protein
MSTFFQVPTTQFPDEPKKAGRTRWTKPKSRPVWMTEEQHLAMPVYLDVRVVKFHIQQKGFKTRDIFIATTLLDEKKLV